MFITGKKAALAVRYPPAWDSSIERVSKLLSVSKSKAVALMIAHSAAGVATPEEWAEKLKAHK